MLEKEINETLNKQLNQELQNAYLYLSMAAYFDMQGLGGFAHFFKKQAEEELGHAMRIYKYIVERGGEIVLHEIPKPKSGWKSILEAVEDFYNAEVENTKRIWKILDLAREKGDKATENFLQWFIEEQVEEENSAMDMLTKVKMVKDNPAGILALDRAYATRQ